MAAKQTKFKYLKTKSYRRRKGAGIRVRSGKESSNDPLVYFLYLIMRDQITPGVIEEFMDSVTNIIDRGQAVNFSNGWLARYAKDVAARLQMPELEVKATKIDTDKK